MLRMMIENKVKSVFCDSSASNELRAIFVSTLDGKLSGINKTAVQLLNVLGNAESFLPEDHIGLVRACMNTRQSLKRVCDFGEICIVWSYQLSDKCNFVYVSGAKLKADENISNSIEKRQKSEVLPLIKVSRAGGLRFCNKATSDLLREFDLEDVLDVLPFSHRELLQACFQGELALTEARCINDKTYVWTYEADTESDEVNIFMRDLRISHEREVISDSSTWKKRELEFLADVSGVTKVISFSTYKLLGELGVNGVDELLSSRHRGLLKACLATSTELTEECKLLNRSIVWTYYPHEDGESVQVYGYEAV